ncbi:MAG TPA: PAS domain S-box protein, partial [Candidatus Polarisedimenticolia bacterium]|nr:PAS domain S-box protein [Candidatus Polarisedimenticolia bacterium]
MPDGATEESTQEILSLRRKVEEYERWFRLLDTQMRVLERERQKLSAVLNHTDAGFLVLDADLKVVWANHIFVQRFGGAPNPGRTLGADCHEILCRRDSTCETCPAMHPFRTGTLAHHEIRLDLKGQTRHLYATGIPIRSPDGTIDETIVMVQDVSDLAVLRQSEEALKESEKRFRSIFEQAGSGMATIGLDGRFLQVNAALCRFLGYSADELVQVTVPEVTHDADLEETRRILGEAAGGRLQSLEIEKRYVRKDGAVVWGRTTKTWLSGADGAPAYAVVLILDITQRKRAEEALKQSEARKGAILETALDGIITIDHEGKVLEFNPVAEKMFGYRREEVIGRVLADLIIPEEAREAHLKGLARCVASGDGQMLGNRIETIAKRSGGEQFPVEVAVTRIPIGGAPMFTGFIRDLTERKRLEAELR